MWRIMNQSQVLRFYSQDDVESNHIVSAELQRGGAWSVPRQPVTHASKTTVNAPGNGVYYTLGFDTVGVNIGNCWVGGSLASRFTANVAGNYVVSAEVWWAANATGYRYAYILRDAWDLVTSFLVPAVNGNFTQSNLSVVLNMGAGQYIEIVTMHTAGVDIQVKGSMRWAKVA